MPSVYPTNVSMSAHLRNTDSQEMADTLLRGRGAIGKFNVNTVDRLVTFELDPGVADHKVMIHGFVPRGWKTDPLFELESGQAAGSWNYSRGQVQNILAGLAYVSVRDQKSGNMLTAQIEPDLREPAKLEDFVTVTAMAGKCQAFMSLDGQFEDVEMKMEPAQVIIARSAAATGADGRREQILGCAIRVGGAEIEGLGRVEIGMFGNENPGKIVAMTAAADFPATMTLDVGKSYITPMGEFYRDEEIFEAENLERFPPFGKKFYPLKEIAPLRNARSGEQIGVIKLGWLVPLCYLDPAEDTFPSKAVANATFEEE
jgi:hypothetical protein